MVSCKSSRRPRCACFQFVVILLIRREQQYVNLDHSCSWPSTVGRYGRGVSSGLHQYTQGGVLPLVCDDGPLLQGGVCSSIMVYTFSPSWSCFFSVEDMLPATHFLILMSCICPMVPFRDLFSSRLQSLWSSWLAPTDDSPTQQISIGGLHKIECLKDRRAVVFACAPHVNQFLDPLVVMKAVADTTGSECVPHLSCWHCPQKTPHA